MKKWILILSLLFFSFQALGQNCKPQCDTHERNFNSLQAGQQHCQGTDPSSPTHSPSNCIQDFRMRWAQTGPLCKKWEIAKDGANLSQKSAVANFALSALCANACFGFAFSPATANKICKFGSGGAIALQLAGGKLFIAKSHSYTDLLQNATGIHSATDLAKLGGIVLALRKKGSLACTAWPFFLGIATNQFFAVKPLRQKADDYCSQIEELTSPQTSAQATGGINAQDQIGSIRGSQPTQAHSASQAGIYRSGENIGLGNVASNVLFSDQQAYLTAAQSSPSGTLIKEMEHQDDFPSLVKNELGMGLPEIADRMNRGESPHKIASQLPAFNKDPNAKSMTDAIQASHDQKQLQVEGGVLTASTGGASSSNPKTSQNLSPTNEAVNMDEIFGKENLTREPAGAKISELDTTEDIKPEADIFHSNYNGSLFQIISERMKKRQLRGQ